MRPPVLLLPYYHYGLLLLWGNGLTPSIDQVRPLHYHYYHYYYYYHHHYGGQWTDLLAGGQRGGRVPGVRPPILFVLVLV